ncbi:Calcineurin-like phosphoesterase [Ruminococcaceae bacterium FB2012]|nr:Calcineurin-like phosphoesterase [Ruminococcaceae bacterium FB2012]
MKKQLLSILTAAAMMLALAGCSDPQKSSEHLEDYVFALKYHDNYNILQLTDIHWNVNSSVQSSKTYLDKLLKEVSAHIKAAQGAEAGIDLVELTGDMFMLANNYHLNEFVDYFEKKAKEYGFVYAPVWGNHDRHSLYNPKTLSEKFRSAEHCIYFEPDDDLYGRSNYIIDLTEDGTKNTPAVWMLAQIDSGAGFSETELNLAIDDDYIRPEQTEWFIKEHELAGKDVPVIAYYHIPQDENQKAWLAVTEEGKDLKNKFFKLEGFADNGKERFASDFIDRAKEHNLKAAFMGHAHNVDWTVEYEGVVIGLGVKTGGELYYAHIDVNSEDKDMQAGLASTGITENFDLMGASLVTLTGRDGSFDLEHLYFNEREAGDFSAWVKW